MTDRRLALRLIGGATMGGIALGRGSGLGNAAVRAARRDLYICEGCDAVGERRPAGLSSVVRLAPPGETGEVLILDGRALDAAGTRPVAGVVVYAHHTDAHGLYSRGSPETEWSRRHGLLRGWAKTDAQGRYRFVTVKPAPYPNRSMPAHIHLFISEPGRRPYYIDDVVFAGEFGVTPGYVRAQELRGGSGIVRLTRLANGAWQARRDIRLESHPV